MDQEHGEEDPATVGRYRVERRLGLGPMGRVLLGVDESGRQAAIRLVHAALAAEPGFRDRFRNEVQVAATAPPWFVAPVLDADPDAEPPWLATAFVEGPSLLGFVTGNGPLGQQGSIALAVRLAEGLAALHGAGLAHRDLKPSNVLLAADGPRLVDFGVIRTADGTAFAGAPVLGPPTFLSPELVAGVRDVGPASDMFSFGSVIVFAAAGRSPFAGSSPAEEAHRVAAAPPDLGPVDPWLREVVLACLAKDPAARPSAAEVRDRLRALDEPDAAAAPTVAVPGAAAAGMPPPPAPPPYAGAPVPAAQQTAFGPPALIAPKGRGTGMRRGVIAAIVAAAVAGAAVALAAVLLLNRGDGQDPVVGAPVAASPSSSTAATTTPSQDGVLEIDAATDDRFGSGSARFATPSGNIACLLAAGEARCDVRERTWQIPPAPAGCAQTYGTGAVLTAGREGELSCVSDTIADPSLEVLAYGQAVRLGELVCVSRETGVRCEDEGSGHGFAVARASYDLF